MSRGVVCKALGSSLIVSASDSKLLKVAFSDVTLPLIRAPKSIVYLHPRAIATVWKVPTFHSPYSVRRQTWRGTQFGGHSLVLGSSRYELGDTLAEGAPSLSPNQLPFPLVLGPHSLEPHNCGQVRQGVTCALHYTVNRSFILVRRR